MKISLNQIYCLEVLKLFFHYLLYYTDHCVMSAEHPPMLWQGLCEEQIGGYVKCCLLRRYYFSYPLPCFPSLQSYCYLLPSVLNISTRKREKFCQQTPHLTWGGGCPSYNLWKLQISPLASPVSKQCNENKRLNRYIFCEDGNFGNFDPPA